MNKSIILQDIGEGIDKVEVTDIIVSKGNNVKIDDIIMIVETEKASMEIPTTINGLIVEIKVKIGDNITPGSEVMIIEPTAPPHIEETNDIPINKPESNINTLHKKDKLDKTINTQTKKVLPSFKNENQHSKLRNILAGPSVRRFARELGCDLTLVNGSGPKGRITKEDVQEYIKQKLTQIDKGDNLNKYSMPTVDFSQFGEIESIPLNKVRRITGQRLQLAWNEIPHVTQFDKADITDLTNYKNSSTQKLSFIPFFIKALIPILQKFPDFNSSIDPNGKSLIRKKYFNIGIAVDTLNGLIVPVIRNADIKSISELMSELLDISYRARNKKIKPNELQGGCFTISSLGGISGTAFTPIINPPEVAILGISRSEVKPIFFKDKFQPRDILPIALSYDHRVIDGAVAARFTKEYTGLLSNFNDIPNINI